MGNVATALFIANRENSVPFFCRTIAVVEALGHHDTDHSNCIGAPAAARRHHNLHCNYMHLQEA